MADFNLVGRIRPVYKGVWNIDNEYTVLETVINSVRHTAYIAIRDVPAGVELTNAEYWGVLADVSDLHGVNGADGKDGGYIIPSVTATDDGYINFSFTPSDPDMDVIIMDKLIQLPEGPAGSDGVGIESVTQSVMSFESGGINKFRITLTDGTSSEISIRNGERGEAGEDGIAGPCPDVQIYGVANGREIVFIDPSSGAEINRTIIYNGSQGAKGDPGPAGKDYSFDPTVYGLPVLELTGDISPIKISKDNKVTLSYVYGERTGTCTLKGQGATSYKIAKAFADAGKAGKFNYTINFDTAFEAADGWGAQKKYCLKANWIDHSHSRNVVSAKLWGLIVKSRTTANATLNALPNGGAVDGFPIVIMLNGEFHGLYTWNIPKDGWMFGLVEDTTKTQAVLGANDHLAATQFKSESAGNDADFELEFVSDEDNADWVTPSLNRLINACINSWGGDLDTTVAQYLDWDSAIDYYIWIVVCKGTDMVDKNYLLTTFDGTKWCFTAYDMDSTYGLEWDGSGLTRAVSNVSFEECATTHRVYELIKRFKTNALKARYNALRQNVLSETRICQYFENFAWAMPSPVLMEDVKVYPTILGSGVNGIDQICRWVRQRLEKCDEWINALPAQETPVNPNPDLKTFTITNTLTNCTTSNNSGTITEGTAYAATITANTGYTLNGATVSVKMGGTDITASAYSNGKITIGSVTGNIVVTIAAVKVVSGYTNLVPTSTDTNETIYNGTGYKDNARLSSSGGVSSSAQTGSVVTGFIPYTAGDTIRLKGAEWLGATAKYTGHYYLHFYNSSKNFIEGISAEGYATNSAPASIVYDSATGVTTVDINESSDFGNAIASAAYFRINAYGKGADLIVTVNEEIV